MMPCVLDALGAIGSAAMTTTAQTLVRTEAKR
jgi:hypothetical protein